MGKKTVGPVPAGTLLLAALLGSPPATAQHEHDAPAGHTAIVLSPGLAALLSEEMLAIDEGIATLLAAMVMIKVTANHIGNRQFAGNFILQLDQTTTATAIA